MMPLAGAGMKDSLEKWQRQQQVAVPGKGCTHVQRCTPV